MARITRRQWRWAQIKDRDSVSILADTDLTPIWRISDIYLTIGSSGLHLTAGALPECFAQAQYHHGGARGNGLEYDSPTAPSQPHCDPRGRRIALGVLCEDRAAQAAGARP